MLLNVSESCLGSRDGRKASRDCYMSPKKAIIPTQSSRNTTWQSMEWIELKRSSPIQIHEPLILIQSNPADDPESESSSVQSGHNRASIYQIPFKIDM